MDTKMDTKINAEINAETIQQCIAGYIQKQTLGFNLIPLIGACDFMPINVVDWSVYQPTTYIVITFTVSLYSIKLTQGTHYLTANQVAISTAFDDEDYQSTKWDIEFIYNYLTYKPTNMSSDKIPIIDLNLQRKINQKIKKINQKNNKN